jgi:hypothetical protein
MQTVTTSNNLTKDSHEIAKSLPILKKNNFISRIAMSLRILDICLF